MFQSAETFAREANLTVTPVGVSLPEGFLSEWWSLFWDAYCGSTNIGDTPNNNNQTTENPPQIVNTSVPMQEGNMLQSVNPLVSIAHENCIIQGADPLIDMPGPSSRPNLVGLPIMSSPIMDNMWQNFPTSMFGISFDPEILGVDAQTTMSHMVAAAQQTEELNSRMLLDQNAPTMDPSSSTRHWSMNTNNYLPFPIAGDGDVDRSWVATTSSEVPPLPPQLLTYNNVGPSWMSSIPTGLPPLPPLLPPIPPQAMPNDPEHEETGSSMSSNSLSPSDANC
ncbi:actin cytoskeleton-regulatory complex protein pan1-like [Andrographis paniculata]|uniref:actin cytoskeleton-regulatory complex protein pan1-like n=1 Tax=Andrographis paniculata TaxID=175694 RepID=UPI0021E930DE|nr:actin cytoskeleton-regulatory complex protein pan1-like [Andrographis paniculata]